MESEASKEKRLIEQKQSQETANRQLKILETLQDLESFQSWRDLIVVPTIQQLEAEIASQEADKMSEVILRSKLKHLNSLKYLFYDVFDQAKAQRQLNK